MEIPIDVTDWLESYLEAEPEIKTKDDLVRLRQEHHSADVAMWAIIARARGDADQDILRPDKQLLLSGGELDISQHIQRLRRKFSIGEDGTEIEIRSFVSPVKNGDDEDYSSAPIVPAISEKAAQYARRYLFKDVLGRVRERLAILTANEVDVREIVDEFITEIWGIVEGLEPGAG